MNGEMIKQFLVGLGFDVDESDLSKFNKAIESASVRVAALYAGIQVAAAGIFWGISKISEGFEQMGYEYRIIAPAINKALLLRRALLQAYAAAGINIVKVVQESVKFNLSLQKTKFILEALYKSVGAKFIPMLTKQMDIFRSKIYANLPKIQAILERVVSFIFKAFEATARLGARVWSILGRVWDFLVKLDTATGGWSTAILGAIAAWNLLNLAFLATPLGMILTGIVALLALFDDLETYREGGDSLFNWGPAIPIIDAISDSIESLWEMLKSVFHVIGDVWDALNGLFSLNGDKFFGGLKKGFDDLIDVFSKFWGLVNSLTTVGDKISTAASSLLTQQTSPYFNAQSFAQPLTSPSNNTNQSVNQQTNITVNGAADATTVGKQVTNEQTRVNGNMTRNLRGATR